MITKLSNEQKILIIFKQKMEFIKNIYEENNIILV